MKTFKLIESYLPIFTGFYNTIFEADEEPMIEDGMTYDDYEWDYKEYHDRVAKACTEIISNELKDLDITIEFQALISPKYYNYSNDSINVAYHLKEDSYKKLIAYIIDNKEDFDGYIAHNYSSYDGFIPFYSNNGTEWLTKYLLDNEKLQHVFGACLDFYLDYNNEFSEQDLYEALSEQGDTIVYGKLIEKS